MSLFGMTGLRSESASSSLRSLNSVQWIQQATQAPKVKNHTATYFRDRIYVIGGYDASMSYRKLLIYSVKDQKWLPPDSIDESRIPERDGHSATLVVDPQDEDHALIVVIGGSLGMRSVAVEDVQILDIYKDRLTWYKPTVRGKSPGRCILHTADLVADQREIYVFRGGDGQGYQNDLHAFHVDQKTWRQVETNGSLPPKRSNHASAMLEDTNELVIFGGWDGTKKLNDMHILNIDTSTWTRPLMNGPIPPPRTGMTLTPMPDSRLFLFGGNTSDGRHDLLHVFDGNTMTWVDTHRSTTTTNLRRPSGLLQVLPKQQVLLGTQVYATTDDKDDDLAEDVLTVASDDVDPAAVFVNGQGPGHRVGHTATAVGETIFIFGGSQGSGYSASNFPSEMFVLDVPVPTMQTGQEHESRNMLQVLEEQLFRVFHTKNLLEVVFSGTESLRIRLGFFR